MLAIALGLKAVHAGDRVYYTTPADLVARTSRAALEALADDEMRFWDGPQLLVIDELGYLPMPGEAAAHLFQVISRRYEHGLIILMTNRGIASWGEIFDDHASPPRSSIASYTTPPSCRSTATATACADTAPASRPSEPASTTQQRVGNSRDRNRGILTIVDTPPDHLFQWTPERPLSAARPALSMLAVDVNGGRHRERRPNSTRAAR